MQGQFVAFTAHNLVFSCQSAIVMAIMSSIMLTIRSSYKKTHIVYPEPPSEKDTEDSNHDARDVEGYTNDDDEEDYDARN